MPTLQVLQVSWNNLASGLVIIKVAAYRITPPPYSPQLFSLAVQGSFTGELQSRFNPGWSGSTSTSCSLPVAHISAAPPVLSNNLNPSFSFATTSDPATAGFQCKLSGTGGSTTAISNSQAVVPLQDWTACTAPKTFAFTSVSGAGDGTYLFQVRATSMYTSLLCLARRCPALLCLALPCFAVLCCAVLCCAVLCFA